MLGGCKGPAPSRTPHPGASSRPAGRTVSAAGGPGTLVWEAGGRAPASQSGTGSALLGGSEGGRKESHKHKVSPKKLFSALSLNLWLEHSDYFYFSSIHFGPFLPTC